MDKTLEILTSLGLSDKQSVAYLALLSHGTRQTSFVAKKANLNRGTAYVVLHELLDKGLVQKSTKNGIQSFTAKEPKYLLEYLERKEQEVQEQKTKVKAAMGHLNSLVNPLTSQPKIEFFEDRDGARRVLENTLTSENKTLCSFLSLADIIEQVGENYFEDYTNQRISKAISLKAIRSRSKDEESFQKHRYSKRYGEKKKDRREVRHVTADLTFPLSMYIYDNKLAVLSSKNEGFSMLIESEELSSMQQKLFDLLWESSSRSPK